MPFLVWTSVVWPMVISSRCPITHILCLNTMAMKYLCGSDLHLSRKYAGKTTIQINQATNCIDVCNCCWCFGRFWNFIMNVSEIIYCEKLEVIKWNEWVTQIYEWTKKIRVAHEKWDLSLEFKSTAFFVWKFVFYRKSLVVVKHSDAGVWAILCGFPIISMIK